jgi:hypothetical protein
VPAYADLNAFTSLATGTRPTFGWSFGRANEAVGFEVEYAGFPSARDARPLIGTIGASAIIQMPPRHNGIRWYGTVGFGIYGESLADRGGSSGNNRNGGVGVKLPLAGLLKVRVDYRYFRLHADEPGTRPQHTDSHRLSAGLTIAY